MTRSDMPTGNRKLHTVGYYKLTGRLLGKGNFARVEEATHTILCSKVAVKIIDTSKIKEDYVARNLEREALVLSRLSHPSIVYLYETLKCGTVFYMVTELAPGGDLCTFIKRQKNGHLDERVARRFGRQLVSAIVHMHNRGVVHRDLKMENIMLDASKEHIKIVDFGLSNVWDPDHALKTHCGSPEYAAPELFIVGQTYGPEVDLWSLGVVLFGMVTGRLPFLTPRDEELTSSEKRRHLLSQINRGLTNYQKKALIAYSSDLQHLVACLLVPNVKKRITLLELKLHPWVVGRHKTRMIEQEFPPLSSFERTSIMKRIAVFLDIDLYKVEVQLKLNRFGTVGGIFNILAHVQYCMARDMGGMCTAISTFRTRSARSQSVGRHYPSAATISPSVLRPKSAILSEESPPLKSLQRTKATFKKSVQQDWATANVILKHQPMDDKTKDKNIPGVHKLKIAWNEHLMPHSHLHVIGSHGVTQKFNQKPATEAQKCTLEMRTRNLKLREEPEHRNLVVHRCSSAQTISTVTQRVRSRPTTSVASNVTSHTNRTLCRPRSIVTNSTVSSNASSASHDIGERPRLTQQGNHLTASKTNPSLRLRYRP